MITWHQCVWSRDAGGDIRCKLTVSLPSHSPALQQAGLQ